MKLISFKSILLAAVVALTFACGDPEKEEAQTEYNEFKSWWSEKTTNIGDASEEQWTEFKTGFNERTAKLDAKIDKLGDKDKEEYAKMKGDYSTWESSNQEKWAKDNDIDDDEVPVAMDEPTRVSWETKLMGKNMGDWSSVTTANVKQTYITFLENVRANKGSWTDADWDYADAIFDKLQARKDQVEEGLDVSDRAKIKALELEFRTLEGGAEAKSTGESVVD